MLKERKKYYIELIKHSFSLREVCFKAGIVDTTGNYDTLKRIIKEENIDIKHFKRRSNYSEPKSLDFYLKKGSNISSFKLKNKLFKSNIKEKKCESCGLTEWMGKPINLQLHHINGDNTDNRIENLQILCPNCHSYTDNFSGKNQKMNIKEKCFNKKRICVDISLLKELLEQYDDINFISKKIGRTPKTVKRYIKKYDLSFNKTMKNT